MFPKAIFLLALVYFLTAPSAVPLYAEACSSRTVPKPRPSMTSSSSMAGKRSPAATTPATTTASATISSTTTTTTTTTARPNISFPTYKCSTTYDAWYCLNEATCFSVKIGESIMYNCECATGFMGPRCEYKELDGSYLPKRPRPLLEKASIASGATLVLLFLLFVCLTLYLRHDHKAKFRALSTQNLNENLSMECIYCAERLSDGGAMILQELDEAEVASTDDWCFCNVTEVELFSDGAFERHSQIKTPQIMLAIKRSTRMY